LAEVLAPYASPFDFMDQTNWVDELTLRYQQDREKAKHYGPHSAREWAEIFVLPQEDWAARMGAMLANEWSESSPHKAMAVLNAQAGGYRVSLRSPRQGVMKNLSAGALAREFPGGGGRARSAGILNLTEADFPFFCEKFLAYYRL
jgi:hypothetical protein